MNAISGTLLAALACLPAPAEAHVYRHSTHFHLTAFLARHAGYSREEADAIATFDEYTDHDPATEPDTLLSHIPPGLFLTPWGARGHYHFADKAQIGRLKKTAFAAENRGRFQPLGRYLHALQDSYAHALWECRGSALVRTHPFEPILGHAFRGAAPDIPSLALGSWPGDRAEDRVRIAVLMAQASYEELREYLAAWRPQGLPWRTFAEIRPAVERALSVDFDKVEVRLDAKVEAQIRHEAHRVLTSEHGGKDIVEMRRMTRNADVHFEMILERLRKREMRTAREPAYHRSVADILFPGGDMPLYQPPGRL